MTHSRSKRTADGAAKLAEQAGKQAAEVADQLKTKAAEVGQQVQETVETVQGKLPDQVKDQAGRAAEQVRATAEQAGRVWEDNAPKPVRQKTSASLQTAGEHRGWLLAAVGAVVLWLAFRRKKG